MSYLDLLRLDSAGQAAALADINQQLEALTPSARVEFALSHLPGAHILSSSFGIQAAVMLHLVTQVKSDIPVVLTDTGYLFPETYRFIDEKLIKVFFNGVFLTVVLNKRFKGKSSKCLCHEEYCTGFHKETIPPLGRIGFYGRQTPTCSCDNICNFK